MAAPKVEIFDAIEQRSPEWYQIRAGLITASDYGAILAKGEGKMRDAVIRRVAGEIITGTPAESYTNDYMNRGREQEAEALALYSMRAKCDPVKVGFIRRGRTGCSPDALIDTTGGVETKTEKADLLISTLLKDEFPPKHYAQVMGSIACTDRQWWDLMIFCRGMPPFIKRVDRDPRYIKMLNSELDRAYEEIDILVRRIRAKL